MASRSWRKHPQLWLTSPTRLGEGAHDDVPCPPRGEGDANRLSGCPKRRRQTSPTPRGQEIGGTTPRRRIRLRSPDPSGRGELPRRPEILWGKGLDPRGDAGAGPTYFSRIGMGGRGYCSAPGRREDPKHLFTSARAGRPGTRVGRRRDNAPQSTAAPPAAAPLARSDARDSALASTFP